MQNLSPGSRVSFSPGQVGFDMSRTAANKCFEAAGLKPSDVDVVELHDCFSANELITYEALGLCPEGECAAVKSLQPLKSLTVAGLEQQDSHILLSSVSKVPRGIDRFHRCESDRFKISTSVA